MQKKTIATAAEMRELINIGSLDLENTFADVNSYSGAPVSIIWDTNSNAIIQNLKRTDEVRTWIDQELHTGNE